VNRRHSLIPGTSGSTAPWTQALPLRSSLRGVTSASSQSRGGDVDEAHQHSSHARCRERHDLEPRTDRLRSGDRRLESELRFSTGSKGGGRTALGVMIGTEDLRAVLQALATRLLDGLELLAQASNVGAQQLVCEIRSLASNVSLVDASLERPRFR
jgi:hypothetical protein